MKTHKMSITFIAIVAVLCLNAVYWGVQAVDQAEADDLAMLSTPPEGFTSAEITALDAGYRALERAAGTFRREDGERTYDDDEDLSPIDLPQTPQERNMEIQIDRIISGYPAKVVSIDHSKKYLVIEAYGWLTRGTDLDCERAMDLFDRLTGLGFILEVQGEWVPSPVNPMNHEWTQYMIENDGRTSSGEFTYVHT